MAKEPMYECKKHGKKIGNPEYPGQSKGAMIRHLMGNKPKGHEMDKDTASRAINRFLK
ncbi:MAG: hypothetical protein PHE88_07955 [Elusimicrobia bacterium]|nr:hypothetical protein [Elusimicrobiota bacterium]